MEERNCRVALYPPNCSLTSQLVVDIPLARRILRPTRYDICSVPPPSPDKNKHPVPTSSIPVHDNMFIRTT